MYSFSDCDAHPNDPLYKHLESTAEAVSLLWGDVPAESAVFAALVHDIGKANKWFQKRIKNDLTTKDKRSFHSRISAVIAWHISSGFRCEDKDEKMRFRLYAFVSVLKHHTNLKLPWGDVLAEIKYNVKDSAEKEIMREQFESMDIEGINSWLGMAFDKFKIPVDIPQISFDSVVDTLVRARPLRVMRMNFSLNDVLEFFHVYGSLLQADKVHSASGRVELARYNLPEKVVDRYIENNFGAPGCELDFLRKSIYSELEENILTNYKDKMFTVTAPTGSGKTLAALNAAIKLRSRINKKNGKLPRIIYCLPFTSIIDQNHRVYSDVLHLSNMKLTSDLLLKHHHLTNMDYISSDPEFKVDGGDLFVETWQSEIIVTTFHQLLHTVFTNKNSELKRFSQLENSIVLMDEVQSIPRKYWDSIRRVFLEIGEKMDARFLLITATKPLIFTQNMSKELLPNHVQYFKKLSRVKLVNRAKEPLTLTSFFNILQKEIKENPTKSRMVVLNQRKAVRDVFKMAVGVFDHMRIFCLSTNLTPLDREKKINIIQQCLKSKQPCLIITTQLIEAGVDLSVHTVDRDIAPLDSIIQAAGRCNRNNSGELGTVNVWSITKENGTPYHYRVYDPLLINLTKEVIDTFDVVEESRFNELAQMYFSRIYNRSEENPVDKKFMIKGEFDQLVNAKDGFALIESNLKMQSYFIIQNDDDSDIWDRFKSLEEEKDLITRRHLFNNLRSDFWQRIVQVYPKSNERCESDVIPLQKTDETYSSDFGFIGAAKEAVTAMF